MSEKSDLAVKIDCVIREFIDTMGKPGKPFV